MRDTEVCLLVDDEVVEDTASEGLEAGEAEELSCEELPVCDDWEVLEDVAFVCDELGGNVVCEVLDNDVEGGEAVLTVAA